MADTTMARHRKVVEYLRDNLDPDEYAEISKLIDALSPAAFDRFCAWVQTTPSSSIGAQDAAMRTRRRGRPAPLSSAAEASLARRFPHAAAVRPGPRQ